MAEAPLPTMDLPEIASQLITGEPHQLIIRELCINNFKSFRQETFLSNLGPGLHIIIGENGAGKSNVLEAIDMAVSDEYQKLHEKEKRQLICSLRSNQAAVLSVILDNKYPALPGLEDIEFEKTLQKHGMKLVLRGLASLLGDRTLKIFNLINPLYHIRQGVVGGLVMMSDGQRLALVKDITSFSVWEKERDRILAEVKLYEERVRNLEASMVTIHEELEHHKKELEEIIRYKDQEKELDHVLFVFTSKECIRFLEKYAAFKPVLDKLVQEMTTLNTELTILSKQIVAYQYQLGVATRQKNHMESYKERLREELEQFLGREQSLQNELDELDDQKAQLETLRGGSLNLANLEKSIQARYEELLESRSTENSAFTAVAKSRALVEFTKEQIGRPEQSGKDATFLAKKNDDLQKLEREQQDVKRKRNAAGDAYKKLVDLMKLSFEKLRRTRSSLEGKRNDGKQLKIEIRNLLGQRNQLQAQQCKIWEEKAKKVCKLEDVSDQLSGMEMCLKSFGGKYYTSYSYVKEIITMFSASADPEDRLAAQNYLGILLEVIESVEKGSRLAVEAAGGKKFFYHVVKTRASGLRILKEFNRREAPGEVVFLSEDTLQDPPTIPSDDVSCINSKPLLSWISYNSCATRAVKHAFGYYIAVRDIADVTSRSGKFNYVSLGGDILKSNGPITGGYRDPSISLLQYQEQRCNFQKTLQQLTLDLEKTTEKESRIQEEMATMTEQIDGLQLQLDKNGTETQELIAKGERLMLEIPFNEKAEAKAAIRVTELFEEAEVLKAMISQRKEDMKANFKCPKLSLEHLEDRKKKWLAAKENHGLQTQNRKRIEKELELKIKCLMSRLDEDANAMDKERLPELTASLQCVAQELKNVKAAIADSTKKLKKIETREGNEIAHINAIQERLDQSNSDLLDKSASLSKGQSELQKQLFLRSAVHIRRKAMMEKVVKLRREGVDETTLQEQYPQYAQFGTADLFAKLVELMNEHKKSRVNLRALDTSDILESKAKTAKKSFKSARKALSSSRTSLEAIMLTGPSMAMWLIKHIQFSLSHIYSEIIGESSREDRDEEANLVLYSENREFGHGDSHAGPSVDETTYWADENFVGAKLQIITRRGKIHDIRTLSGGQRTTLSLAFILALQQNTPARFFLFDEIDQALDPAHVKGVVKVLKRFSEENHAQFFCTTFNKDFVNAGNRIFHVTHDGSSSRVEEIDADKASELPFLGIGSDFERLQRAAAAAAASDGETIASASDASVVDEATVVDEAAVVDEATGFS